MNRCALVWLTWREAEVFMNCPLETRENAQQLLDYCARQLDSQTAAILARHIAVCPACRECAAQRSAVGQAMEAWEAQPGSAGFNRKLYARIENDSPGWRMLLRPVALRWNMAASVAGVGLLLTAGVLLNHPAAGAPPQTDVAQVESVQPEQVEHALDAMDMLAE